jgi:hypothetical protein
MSEIKPIHIVSFTQIIIGILLGLFTVLVLNGALIFKYIFRFESETFSLIQSEVTSRSDTLFSNLNNFPLTASLVTMVLWSIVGVVVYFVSQFIVKSAKNIEEDVVVSVSYVHPKNFRQTHFWFSVLLQSLYAFFAVTVLGIWLLLSISIFIPFSSVILLIGLDSLSTNIVYGVVLSLCSMGVASFAYIGLFILFRTLRSRVF